jgi:hypothetical protein
VLFPELLFFVAPFITISVWAASSESSTWITFSFLQECRSVCNMKLLSVWNHVYLPILSCSQMTA